MFGHEARSFSTAANSTPFDGVTSAGQLLGAVTMFLIGWWSYQAAEKFASVASTDTADQRLLMDGFSLLRRVFLLQGVSSSSCWR